MSPLINEYVCRKAAEVKQGDKHADVYSGSQVKF